ncbi:putative transcriptional regulatory protein, partial [Lachnellula suecica]
MEVTEHSRDHGKQDSIVSQKSDGDPPPKKPGSKEPGRKRTKTGCRTCRKRRIKCGEERPTCQNCIKSKRNCEGYNQRVVFKDPLNLYRPSLSHGSGSRHGGPQQPPNAIQNPLPIAPKLPRSSGPSLHSLATAPSSTLPPVTSPGAERRLYAFGREDSASSSSNLPPQSFQSLDITFDSVDSSHLPEPSRNPNRQETATHYDFNNFVKQERLENVSAEPAQTGKNEWLAGSSGASFSPAQEPLHDTNKHFTASSAFYHSLPANTDWTPARPSPSNSSGSHFPYQAQQGSALPVSGESSFATPGPVHQRFNELPENYQGQPSLNTQIPESTDWQQSAVSAHSQIYDNEDDDDPFDVSDDDILMGEYADPGKWQRNFPDDHLKNNDLGIVVALQAGQDNLQLRSFMSFIDRPDMLATYVPSPQSSPLKDSMVARIFCHFVNVTAPSISMFERHPANPSLIFQGKPIPPSQQNIWTYTFPTVALHNSAVLHAMLALASLHIAKLQNAPITAALKHYSICLRRIAKCLNSPTKRSQPATLAAAMLLAFFEVWSADHHKWTNHLLGARQLVRDIDFAGMTRYIKSQKVRKREEELTRYYQAPQQGAGHNFHDDRLRYQAYVDDVDENLVGMLMGKKLRYDQFGQVLDDNVEDPSGKTYSEKELETYETQRDLFWWYCKQDAYQGLLGGGRPFMKYDLWSHCPPRAPMGRLNATYGTFDHIVLLMGRLVDFAAKDLKRKRLQMKANGGWRPPDSLLKPQGPPGSQGPPQAFPQMPNQGFPQIPQMPQMPQVPNFSGMFPNVQEPQLPMGFSPQGSSPQSSSQSSEDADLEAQRVEAEEEWHDIRNAFSILEDHFGDDFQALGPEFSAPIQTPFGPALQYRTYGIAGIWMNFYMALISCHRSHPSMPPAAMMAAGVAARQTASFANELGRIAAGIAPDCENMKEVNPGVGAALMESTMCLFISGVQYQDATQRAWTVNRLRNVARLTGWQTAHAIAAGCETSWCKAAEMGKGPPYTRVSEQREVPDDWQSARSRGTIEGSG